MGNLWRLLQHHNEHRKAIVLSARLPSLPTPEINGSLFLVLTVTLPTDTPAPPSARRRGEKKDEPQRSSTNGWFENRSRLYQPVVQAAKVYETGSS